MAKRRRGAHFSIEKRFLQPTTPKNAKKFAKKDDSAGTRDEGNEAYERAKKDGEGQGPTLLPSEEAETILLNNAVLLKKAEDLSFLEKFGEPLLDMRKSPPLKICPAEACFPSRLRKTQREQPGPSLPSHGIGCWSKRLPLSFPALP